MTQISIKAARINAGLRQEEVAEKLEMTVRTYSDIETGKRRVKAPEAVYLSSLFGIPVEMLKIS